MKHILGLYQEKIKNLEFRVNYDVHVFDTIDSEEKAYWLGFLMADGYVRSDSNVIGIELSYVDIDHMKKFKKIYERY